MKNKVSLKKNAAFNVIKTVATIVFPLITFPYVSRVLLVENLGKVNYGLSIINYFSLIAALGISTYAIREGSKIRDRKNEFRNFSNQIFSINIITTIIAYILLAFTLICVKKLHSYALLISIQSLTIIFTTIGVEWVNNIFEDFKYIAVRSIFVQACSIVFMLVLIHRPDDYYWYAVINTSVVAVNNTINVIYCRRYCKLGFTTHIDWKKHLKPILIFFANNLAVQIYVSSDTTMLGWMVGDYYTGLYSAGVRIYSFVKQLLVSLYSVSIPRLSQFYEKGKIEEFKKLITEMMGYIAILAIPATVGLICVSNEIIELLCGEAFLPASGSLRILALALLFAIFGGIITSCINVPICREKDNLIATIIAAVGNVSLNIFLIPIFYDRGAALTTLIAELTVGVVCIFLNRKNFFQYVKVKELLKQVIQAVLGSIVIVIVSIVMHKITTNIFLILICTIILSVLGYYFVLLLLRNKYVFEINKKVMTFIKTKKMHN